MKSESWAEGLGLNWRSIFPVLMGEKRQLECGSSVTVLHIQPHHRSGVDYE